MKINLVCSNGTSRFNFLSRASFFGFILCGLQACVNTNILILDPINSETTALPEGEGLLVVQVADTTPTGGFYPVTQLTLAAKDVNVEEDKLPRLVSVDSKGSSTVLFAGSLPANEYSITSLRSFHQIGDSYFSRFYPAGIELGTFRVEANKTTDLGLLGLYIERTGEDYRYATTRFTANTRGLAELSNINPNLMATVLTNNATLTWDEDGKGNERQNQYRQAINRQNVFGVPQVNSAEGTLIYPSRAGVIVKRTAELEWELDAFTDDVELRQAAKLGTNLVVVTEFNEIHARADGSEQWQQKPGPESDGIIMRIGKQPSDELYAVLLHDKAFSVWTAPTLSGPWTERDRIERVVGFLENLNHFGADRPNDDSTILESGDYLFMSFGTGLYRYNFVDGSSSKLRNSKITSMQRRNGSLTTVDVNDAYSARVSFDQGESWEKTRGFYLKNEEQEAKFAQKTASSAGTFPRAKLIGHPIFTSQTRAFAVHTAIGKKGKPFLISTENKGKVWRNAGTELPDGCALLVLATESSILLRCFLSGEFYQSDDEGATWNLEREVSET